MEFTTEHSLAFHAGYCIAGRFELLRLLTSTPPMECWHALDQVRDRIVSVWITTHDASECCVSILRESARIWIAMPAHPNVLEAYDWIEEDGNCVVVAEAADKHRDFPFHHDNLELAGQVCQVYARAAIDVLRGLQHAQAHGFPEFQRLANPANWFTSTTRRIKVGGWLLPSAKGESLGDPGREIVDAILPYFKRLLEVSRQALLEQLDSGEFAGDHEGLVRFASMDSGLTEAIDSLIAEESGPSIPYGEVITRLEDIHEILAGTTYPTPSERETYATTLVDQGRLLAETGNPETALHLFDKAVIAEPGLFEGWYYKGVMLGSLGRFEEAIFCFDGALDIRPASVDILLHRAMAKQMIGDLEAALDDCEEALRRRPTVLEGQLMRTELLELLGDEEEAHEQLQETLDDHPENPEAWYLQATVSLRDGALDDAKRALHRVLKQAPEFTAAWLLQAEIYAEEGNNKKAVSALRRVLKQRPESEDAHRMLVTVYLNLEDFHGARRLLGESRRLFRNRLWVWEALARVNAAIGARDDALDALERFFAAGGESPEMALLQGQMLESAGRDEEALQVYAQITERDPRSADGWIAYGSLLGKLQRLEEALRAFEEATTLAPDDSEAWYQMAQTLYLLDRFSEAIAASERCLELDGKTFQHRVQHGVMLLRAGREEAGRTYLLETLDYRSENPDILAEKAAISLHLGEVRRALQFARRALDLAPLHAQAWYHKGQALFELKRFSEAARAFRQVREITPHWTDAWVLEADALYQNLEFELAAKVYQSAIQLDPSRVDAVLLLGQTYLNMDDYERALDAFEAGLKLHRSNGSLWLGKAKSLRMLDDPEGAEAAFTEGLEVEPSNVDLRIGYARFLEQRGEEQQAQRLLEEAQAMAPDHPVFQGRLDEWESEPE